MDNSYGSQADSYQSDNSSGVWNDENNDEIRDYGDIHETVIDGERIRWESNRPLKLGYAGGSVSDSADEKVADLYPEQVEQNAPKYNSWLIY